MKKRVENIRKALDVAREKKAGTSKRHLRHGGAGHK